MSDIIDFLRILNNKVNNLNMSSANASTIVNKFKIYLESVDSSDDFIYFLSDKVFKEYVGIMREDFFRIGYGRLDYAHLSWVGGKDNVIYEVV